jgi:hypothetical protein
MQPPPAYQQPQQPEALNHQENKVQQSPDESIVFDALNQEARKRAGTKDLGCGFLFLVGGAVITLVTWTAAKPGGSFWVMWGAMAIGAFYLIRGLYRKITSNTDLGVRLGWVLGSIILVGGIVGGAVAITNRMTPSALTPPSNLFILSEDNTAWKDEINDIVVVSGTVTNTHSEWSIKNVNVELEATDAKGNIVKTFRISVVPDKLTPGEKGIYNQTLQVPYSCETVRPVLKWEWEAP